MRIKLKPLSQQVIVITGATSGIGLVTARMAAVQGAKLVLAARSEAALEQLCAELNSEGAQTAYVAADVGDEAQVRKIADAAFERFGGFDTWINNAGISIYGRVEDVPVEDQRKLFDTNFWGVVHGARVALEHLKRHGGALINLGSEVSEVGVPLQAAYVASKHAVKGYTDALRAELQHAKAPVSVTLIRPAGIDTLFVEHAKNYMEVEPRLPPPIYAPEIVARAILHAATYPQRDIYVGGASRLTTATARLAPRFTDWLMRTVMVRAQKSTEPAGSYANEALHAPRRDLRERHGFAHVRERSYYTQAALHPKTTAALGAAVLAGLAWWLTARPKRLSSLRRS